MIALLFSRTRRGVFFFLLLALWNIAPIYGAMEAVREILIHAPEILDAGVDAYHMASNLFSSLPDHHYSSYERSESSYTHENTRDDHSCHNTMEGLRLINDYNEAIYNDLAESTRAMNDSLYGGEKENSYSDQLSYSESPTVPCNDTSTHVVEYSESAAPNYSSDFIDRSQNNVTVTNADNTSYESTAHENHHDISRSYSMPDESRFSNLSEPMERHHETYSHYSNEYTNEREDNFSAYRATRLVLRELEPLKKLDQQYQLEKLLTYSKDPEALAIQILIREQSLRLDSFDYKIRIALTEFFSRNYDFSIVDTTQKQEALVAIVTPVLKNIFNKDKDGLIKFLRLLASKGIGGCHELLCYETGEADFQDYFFDAFSAIGNFFGKIIDRRKDVEQGSCSFVVEMAPIILLCQKGRLQEAQYKIEEIGKLIIASTPEIKARALAQYNFLSWIYKKYEAKAAALQNISEQQKSNIKELTEIKRNVESSLPPVSFITIDDNVSSLLDIPEEKLIAKNYEHDESHGDGDPNKEKDQESIDASVPGPEPEFQEEAFEWQQLCLLYQQYEYGNTARLERRLKALQDIANNGFSYQNQTYTLNANSMSALNEASYDHEAYGSCYGNQLQQVMHQECIELVEQTALLQNDSPLRPYKESFMACIDAIREYNQSGSTKNACQVADLYWALFDYHNKSLEAFRAGTRAVIYEIVTHPVEYGSAIAEGALAGTLGVINHAIEHPIQTAGWVFFGEYLAAYYLGKALGVVGCHSVIATIDPEQAKDDWNEFLKPVEQFLDGIEKRQITLRDVIRGGSATAAGFITQGKLLNGLGKIVRRAKDNAIKLLETQVMSPKKYISTPEGLIVKIIHENNNKINKNREFYKIKSEELYIYRTIKGTNERCRIIGPLNEEKAWVWAEKEYDKIRKLKDDIHIIAKHTNKHEFQIARVKNHLFFYDKHILDSNIGRLDSDPEIARAWNRLYNGDFILNDIKLLEHEYFESKLELLHKTTLRKAHSLTQSAKGRPWSEPLYEGN